MKEEFCRNWVKLLQNAAPDTDDAATEPTAPAAAEHAEREPAPTNNAAPPATDDAAPPATDDAATETWEEWEEANDPIIDENIASPSER